jgi:hypothetical protein
LLMPQNQTSLHHCVADERFRQGGMFQLRRKSTFGRPKATQNEQEKGFVILNLFQDLLVCMLILSQEMLKQVQHDGNKRLKRVIDFQTFTTMFISTMMPQRTNAGIHTHKKA